MLLGFVGFFFFGGGATLYATKCSASQQHLEVGSLPLPCSLPVSLSSSISPFLCLSFPPSLLPCLSFSHPEVTLCSWQDRKIHWPSLPPHPRQKMLLLLRHAPLCSIPAVTKYYATHSPAFTPQSVTSCWAVSNDTYLTLCASWCKLESKRERERKKDVNWFSGNWLDQTD